MKSIRIISICTAIPSILSCIIVTSALAADGPFYKTNLGRLMNGQNIAVESKMTMATSYTLKATIEGTAITVKCTSSIFPLGSTLNGSTGGNAGTSAEGLKLSGCTQAGNGLGCNVAFGEISFAALDNTLGYSEEARKGKVQVLFKPASGTEIASVSFVGTCTKPGVIVLRGSMVAEALSNGETVEVGKEPAIKAVLELYFPPTLITKIWIELSGSLTLESPSLTWGGNTVTTFEGQFEVYRPTRETWGLFTKLNPSKSVFLSAEWLDNGVAVTANSSTETTDELLLEDTKASLGKVAVLCSELLDGWVGPNSLGWVSEILNLAGEAISTTPLTGLALECTAQEGCESSSAAKIWPLNLGWETGVDLMEQAGNFFTLLFLPHSGGGNPGWELECLALGISIVDECATSGNASELTLEGAKLLEKLSLAFAELAETKLPTCSLGGEESGVVEGGGSIALKAGGELTASSEGSVS